MASIFDNGVMDSVIDDSGFIIEHTEIEEPREARYVEFEELGLSKEARDFWKKLGHKTMWGHQNEAIKEALGNNHICVSTSTSSGKTEIFQTIAIEMLARIKAKNRNAKVLAIYSAKALNRQQRKRWEATGLKVGQIDGDDTNIQNRITKLIECDVIVMTPDVLHAFLLANLHNPNYGGAIKEFIRNICLVIIDEVHLYKGVFGTNSAYLFRRINNIRRLLRKDNSVPLYVTASATLPNPSQHSEDITGVKPFVNIGMTQDCSPMAQRIFLYIQRKDEKKSLADMIADLAIKIANHPDAKSITFVSGRQQTGDLVLKGEDVLRQINTPQTKLYPFRAGVEAEAREEILTAMENANFNGIISTSALEIGIDVSGLNVCILANIPFDRNSYLQRIGRVGRGGSNNKSYVIIVNDESLNGRLLFDSYNYDMMRLLPDLEPALHLDSDNVKFAHAACHVHTSKLNCEIDDEKLVDNSMSAYFPSAFVNLCRQIVTGNRPKEYDQFIDRIETPHKTLSLRNMQLPYQIVENGNVLYGETVTPIQLFREAYKGAIRSTTRMNQSNNKPETYKHKVNYIDKADRQIHTVKVNYRNVFPTIPFFRTFVNPNLSKAAFIKGGTEGKATILNIKLYENRIAYGYYQLQGKDKIYNPYPMPFQDEMSSTGVIISHPTMNEDKVDVGQIARLVFEAFLMQKAFDRNDINHWGGKLKVPSQDYGFKAGDKFISIYDVNQLNITGNLLDDTLLKQTFQFLDNNLQHFSNTLFENPINKETQDAVKEICNDIINNNFQSINQANIGNTISVFAFQSPAIWERIDKNTGIVENVPCIIMGVNKNASQEQKVTYNIFVISEGKAAEVEMDDLQSTDNSIFRNYNWEAGTWQD